MTPLLVFFTFVIGAVFFSSGKASRKVSFYEGEAEGLKEVFPGVDNESKICRYYFSGELSSPLVCCNEFECNGCKVHKRFSQNSEFEDPSLYSFRDLHGIKFSPALFYHRGHTCVSVGRNGQIKVGIDGFLLKILGDKVSEVVFPEKGEFVETGDILFSLKVGDEYFPVISPLSGEIVKIKDSAIEELDCEDRVVWFFGIKPFELFPDLQSLLKGKEAEEWLKHEIRRFSHLLFKDSDFAADGGLIDFSSLKEIPAGFVEKFLLSYKK